MFSADSDSPAVHHIPKEERWFAVIVFALALVLRILYAWHFRVDSDEPQHLHVVWGWTQGQIPYRDFFDNHTPIFQALCAPLFYVLGPRADILGPMRIAMIPLFILTIGCVWWAVREFVNPRVALWSAMFAALLPPYFLSSIEFRPDELWALVWLVELAVLTTGRITAGRMFLAGVILGLSFCVSMKTSLFAAALLLSYGSVLGLRRYLGLPGISVKFSAKCAAAFLAGVVIIPVIVVAYFVAHGAGEQMYYCVIKHNMLSDGTSLGGRLKMIYRWVRWFPLIALGGYIIGRRTVSRDIRVRQAFVFFASAFYYITLVSFWPIITDEDYLPHYPALMITAGPAIFWFFVQVVRFPALGIPKWSLPATLVAAEFFMAGFRPGFAREDDRLKIVTFSPMVDETEDKTEIIANVLKMTDPGDYVMDSKGETIYRNRPFYYVLEGLTLRRLKRGLLADDIPELLVSSRTPVATLLRMPAKAKDFINGNYVPIAFRLLTLGKIICQPGVKSATPIHFDLAIPARYALVTPSGPATGILDGAPFTGPKELAVGSHEFIPSEAGNKVVLVWAQAVERGFSPFTPIKKDKKSEQD